MAGMSGTRSHHGTCETIGDVDAAVTGASAEQQRRLAAQVLHEYQVTDSAVVVRQFRFTAYAYAADRVHGQQAHGFIIAAGGHEVAAGRPGHGVDGAFVDACLLEGHDGLCGLQLIRAAAQG